MGIFDFFNSKGETRVQNETLDVNAAKSISDPAADFSYMQPVYNVLYDGEKNPGEIGLIKRYIPDYYRLRQRSWQAYLDSEITQLVINKLTLWIIGEGLRLQSEPNKIVLDSERINVPPEFTKLTEARFKVYSKLKDSDNSKLNNLHRIAKTVITNAIVGGDLIAVLRFKKRKLSVQLIDGAHVKTPINNSTLLQAAKDRGNTIIDGIELSKEGEHIAYYVQESLGEFRVVKTKAPKTGRINAFMVYGLRYRLDCHRGIPLISAVMETLKKLERYKEAAVGSAEEVAKVAFAMVHKEFSTGENPFIKNMREGLDLTDEIELSDEGVSHKEAASKIALTTNKQAINMPIGSDLKRLESSQELSFSDFYTTNINIVTAVIGIPPEVALSMYNSNFSASRAALKDWERILHVHRNDYGFQFYQNFYESWLDFEILQNKINAPGYLEAKNSANHMVLGSYRNARWVGANVPHIDPVKEVKAERLKLGDEGGSIPLTTSEAATEALSSGEFDPNLDKFATELSDTKTKLNLDNDNGSKD